MDEANIKTQDLAYYDIDWDKLKTIKDIKLLLQILASQVVIDHNEEEDIQVYETLKPFLIKSDG